MRMQMGNIDRYDDQLVRRRGFSSSKKCVQLDA
jgi:hypothetical protein